MDQIEAREYAEHLIRSHAEDIEWLTIHEMADSFFGNDLNEEEAKQVYEAISTARLKVFWSDQYS